MITIVPIYCYYYYYVHSSVSIVVRLNTHSPGEGHASEFRVNESHVSNNLHRSDTHNKQKRRFHKNETRTTQVRKYII